MLCHELLLRAKALATASRSFANSHNDKKICHTEVIAKISHRYFAYAQYDIAQNYYAKTLCRYIFSYKDALK